MLLKKINANTGNQTKKLELLSQSLGTCSQENVSGGKN